MKRGRDGRSGVGRGERCKSARGGGGRVVVFSNYQLVGLFIAFILTVYVRRLTTDVAYITRQ